MSVRYTIDIVIPMAGEGARFANAGFELPKPFIDVGGQTMIECVMENLAIDDARYILVARSDHAERVAETIARLADVDGLIFHLIDGPTDGTACTVLAALEGGENDRPLLIANADQVIDCPISLMIDDARERDLDGSIMVFQTAPDPKWSYARLGGDGYVDKVAEKTPISEFATAGFYYFKTAEIFITAAQAMINADDRVNAEFYTCPVYNYLIKSGGRVGVYEIAPNQMHDLGTPENLEAYLKLNRD